MKVYVDGLGIGGCGPLGKSSVLEYEHRRELYLAVVNDGRGQSVGGREGMKY
jgi:hypothetical protein